MLGLWVGLGASLLLIAGCRCTIHNLHSNVHSTHVLRAMISMSYIIDHCI